MELISSLSSICFILYYYVNRFVGLFEASSEHLKAKTMVIPPTCKGDGVHRYGPALLPSRGDPSSCTWGLRWYGRYAGFSVACISNDTSLMRMEYSTNEIRICRVDDEEGIIRNPVSTILTEGGRREAMEAWECTAISRFDS